jgi:hypothetical protein
MPKVQNLQRNQVVHGVHYLQAFHFMLKSYFVNIMAAFGIASFFNAALNAAICRICSNSYTS